MDTNQIQIERKRAEELRRIIGPPKQHYQGLRKTQARCARGSTTTRCFERIKQKYYSTNNQCPWERLVQRAARYDQLAETKLPGASRESGKRFRAPEQRERLGGRRLGEVRSSGASRKSSNSLTASRVKQFPGWLGRRVAMYD